VCKSEPISTPGTLCDENNIQNRNYGPAANENNELIKMIETKVGVVTVAEDGKVDVRSVQSNEIPFNIPRMPKKQHRPPTTNIDKMRNSNQPRNCLNNKTTSDMYVHSCLASLRIRSPASLLHLNRNSATSTETHSNAKTR
jgi:hypothetical protein